MSKKNRDENVLLVGFKSSGKTRIGKMLAKKLGLRFEDIDAVIEGIHSKPGADRVSVRGIYRRFGEGYFQKLEAKALKKLSRLKGTVISLGGGTVMNAGFDKKKFAGSLVVHIHSKPSVVYSRIRQKGFPPFFDKKSPKKSFESLLKKRTPVYKKVADLSVENIGRKPSVAVNAIIAEMEKKYGG